VLDIVKEKIMVTFEQVRKTFASARTTYSDSSAYYGTVHPDHQSRSGLSVDDLVSKVREQIAPELAFKKCVHCGQWGGVMLPCGTCGAPIDP
jgi:hypothetical protein